MGEEIDTKREAALKEAVLKDTALGEDQSAALGAIKELGSIKDPSALDALLEISERARSKVVRKEARKAIWRLKRAGVRATKTAEPDPRDTHSRSEDVSGMGWKGIDTAYLSVVDGDGYRLAVTCTPAAFGAVRAQVFVLGDTEGIHACGERSMSKGEIGDFISRIARGQIVAEVWPKAAVFEVFRHEEISRSLGHSLPMEYFTIKPPDKDLMPEHPEPPAYWVMDRREVKWNPLLLDGSASLLGEEAFRSWLIPEADLAPYIDDLESSEDTVIVVGLKSKEERRAGIISRATSSFFDPERRRLYKRRLEEQAFVLFMTGRKDVAKTALAAAVALDPESGTAPEKHPFASAFVEMSMEFHLRERRQSRVSGVKTGVERGRIKAVYGGIV
ncbi:MAG TPA: hypothetical protein GX507_04030 [Clostridia bacterium]|nr:hypothetical protein [Clostridia bacterium]